MPPSTAHDRRFRLRPETARKLATEFGTPLYVVSEAVFRERIRSYKEGFASAAAHPEISFASKANSTVALIAIAHSEGCEIDVASEGEFRAALKAGVAASQCRLHGNNKSFDELKFAVDQGIGQIIVDHFSEVEMLATLLEGDATKLVIRLAPGVDPVTHSKISTGQADTKFGFNITDGSAEQALIRCLELGLPVIGFHCHVGSQLLDPEAQRAGGETIAAFAAEMLGRHHFTTTYLNLGGGLGIQYVNGQSPMDVAEYCKLVVQAVQAGLGDSGLKPILGQEPGRSLIGEAGVTLYQVGVIKTVPAQSGHRTYVAIDGGMSDNPRPALYGSKYTVERVARAEGAPPWAIDASESVSKPVNPIPPVMNPETGHIVATVSGKHCETDRMFEDVEFPADLQEGDLLQVLSTGAYNSAMASNYNRFRRPGTVLITTDGSFELIQRPETWDELLEREILPQRLKQ